VINVIHMCRQQNTCIVQYGDYYMRLMGGLLTFDAAEV